MTGVAALVAAAALAVPARGDVPAAVVAGRAITVAAVDARCGDPCARLRADIAARRWATLEALVGEALLDGTPPVAPPAVSEGDVDAYLAAHPADFHGPPDRDRAAVRFFLEREARRAAERAQIAAERARRPPRLHAAPTDPALAADQPPDLLLAEAGSRAIRIRDVDARLALPLFRLRGALARERRRVAAALVDEQAWTEAARARGVDVATVRDGARAAAAPVGDADLDRYWEAELRPRGIEKRPDRLRPYLAFRAARDAEDAALAALRARYGARVVLAEPAPPTLALGAGRLGWRGEADGPVRLVFLTGYRDTSRAMWRVVAKLAREPGTALAVRPLLPLWDPEATAVAAAVHCAAGADRGWALLERVAGGAAVPSREALARVAAAVGLAPDAFAACVDDPRTVAAVRAESAEAEALGLDEPPAILVDGIAFTGRQKRAIRDFVADRRRERAASGSRADAAPR